MISINAHSWLSVLDILKHLFKTFCCEKPPKDVNTKYKHIKNYFVWKGQRIRKNAKCYSSKNKPYVGCFFAKISNITSEH